MTTSLPIAFLGVGSTELLLVLVVAFVLLGPRELPKIARTIGKFMAKFGSFSQDFNDQIMRIAEEPPGQPGAEGPDAADGAGSLNGANATESGAWEKSAEELPAHEPPAAPPPADTPTAKKEGADHEPAG